MRILWQKFLKCSHVCWLQLVLSKQWFVLRHSAGPSEPKGNRPPPNFRRYVNPFPIRGCILRPPDYYSPPPPGFLDFPTALFSFRQGSRIFNSTKRAKTWSWRKSCAHLKAQKKCGRKTKWRRLFNCNFRGNLEPLGTQEKPENIWQMYSNLCSSNLRLWALHCRTFSWKPTGFFLSNHNLREIYQNKTIFYIFKFLF